MNDKNKTIPPGKKIIRMWMLLTPVTGLLLLMGWWTGNQYAAGLDAEMRENLMRQSVQIADSINPDLAKKLTFTINDKGTPSFELIREQMISHGKSLLTGNTSSINKLNVYSMALRDGSILFGPENIDEKDPLASPPGTVYKLPPPGIYYLFNTGRSFTIGPFTDEYGTFVSTFAPVIDKSNGKVVMVIGIDVIAQDWQTSLNDVRMKPLMAVIVIILFIFSVTVFINRRNRSIELGNVKFKIWIVAPVGLFILIALLFLSLFSFWQFEQESFRDMNLISNQFRNALHNITESEVMILKSKIDVVSGDSSMLEAWQKRDLESLKKLADPVFENIKSEYGITHFYFITPEGKCLLRVHQPQRSGDFIDRLTLLAAKRTEENAWGIELGPMGSLTLRYVKPWIVRGKLIGFIELGIEIDQLTTQISRNMNIEVLTVIRKNFISREKYEAGRVTFGFTGMWNVYKDFVIAHQTTSEIPGSVIKWIEHQDYEGGNTFLFTASYDEKKFTCSAISLMDFKGSKASSFIIMKDTTALSQKVISTLILNLILAGSLLTGILILLWSVTGIAEQQLGLFVRRLSESEEKFRSMFENHSSIMLLIEPETGKILEANIPAEKFYGYRIEQLKTMNISQINLFSREQISQEMERAVHDFRNYFIFPHRLADGSIRTVEVYSSPILLNNKSVLFSVIHDITERRQTENTLIESENIQRLMFSNLPIGIVIIDKETRVIERINDHAQKIFGKPSDTLIGQRCHGVLCPTFEGLCPVCDQKQEVDNTEREMRLSDGSSIPVLKSVKQVEIGGRIKLLECFFDISERKRVELALRESEANFYDFFKSMNDMVMVASTDGKILSTNIAAVQNLGYKKEKLKLMNLMDFFPVDTRAEVWNLFQTMLRGEHKSYKLQIESKSGESIPVEARVFLGRWNGDYCIYGIYKNITSEQESEQRFEHLFRNNPAVMALSRMSDRKLIDVNNAFTKVFGYSDEESIGHTPVELNLFMNPELQNGIIDKLKKEGSVYDVELQIRRKDGEIVDGLFSREIFKIHGEQYFLTVMLDITDRKRLEEEKRQLDVKYKILAMAIEQSPATVVITDLAGNIEFVNPKFVEISGYTFEEAVGQNPRILKGGDKPSSEYRELWDTILSGRNWSGVFQNKKKSGELYWESALISPVKDENGTVSHFLAVKEDISTRKKIEDEFQKMTNRLSMATRAGGVGVWEYDIIENTLIWDEQMYRLYGIKPTQFRGVFESWKAALHPDDLDRCELEFYKAINYGSEYDTEFRVVWPDGSVQNIRALATVERDNSGKSIRMVGVNWGITDIKKNEKLLSEARYDAEASNKSKSEFLASMSHEIRTPMNGVISMTNLLLDMGLSPKQRHYAQIIRSSGESLLSLINDILDFSKIEAFKLDLEILDFNISRVMEDTVELMFPKAEEKKLLITSNVDLAVPLYLRGDPGRLRQIILNLISNAIKFTVKGKIELSVVLEEDIGEWVRLRFSVTDNGIGIPKDKQDSIFSPFTQADNSVTRKYGGTGLGLTISRQLAELMGGSIGVESEAGRGSTFWFTAIFEKQDETKIQESIESDESIYKSDGFIINKNVRILLAEDNFTNQIVAVEMLKKIGYYGVDIAGNGQEAIAALQSIDYDLILMDCHMPEMDGFETTRQIRSSDPDLLNTEILIIAMTALAMKGDRDQAINAGMDDYLSKPVELQDLSKMLEKWLSKNPDNLKESENVDDNKNGSSSASDVDPSKPKSMVYNKASFLSRLMDDENLVTKIGGLFLEDMPVQIEKLAEAVNSGNSIEAGKQAHKIKGAAANVGGETVRDVASAMEIAGDSGDNESLRNLLPELQNQFKFLKEVMEKS